MECKRILLCMRSHVTIIFLALPLIALPLAAYSSSAHAFSPEEADAMASVVGHPLPAYVVTPIVDDGADGAPPDAMFAPGGPPLPIYLNGEGGRYVCGSNNNSAENISTIACGAS